SAMRAGASAGRRRRRRRRPVSSISYGKQGSDKPEADAAGKDGVSLDGQAARPRLGEHTRAIGTVDVEACEPFATAVDRLHEAELRVAQRDNRMPTTVASQGKLHPLAPAFGEPLGVVAL